MTTASRTDGGNAPNGFQSISSGRIARNTACPGWCVGFIGSPVYLAFLLSVSIRSLAAGPDEAGFWPVISWPSATV